MSTLALPRLVRVFLVGSLFALVAVAVAAAQTAAERDSGGVGFVTPEVTGVKCLEHCSPGTELRLKGKGLQYTDDVVFRGRKGAKDDVSAAPIETRSRRVLVTIPFDAHSGRVRAVVGSETADGPRVSIGAAASAKRSGVFPLRARHRYGDGIGAGRGHQGQDIFAKCGKPVVAALPGKVAFAEYHGAAGNYVVIDAADGTSQAYMHLQEPTIVKVGQTVGAGQRLGDVGDTGRASGCHLHFELWSAPGWYDGGEPIDPLPQLKAWDRSS